MTSRRSQIVSAAKLSAKRAYHMTLREALAAALRSVPARRKRIDILRVPNHVRAASRLDMIWLTSLIAALGWIPVICITDDPLAVADYIVLCLIVLSVMALSVRR